MVAKSVISITQDAIPDVLPGSTRTINFTMDTNGTEPAGARLEALMVDDVKVTHMTNYPPAKLLINDAGNRNLIEPFTGWYNANQFRR